MPNGGATQVAAPATAVAAPEPLRIPGWLVGLAFWLFVAVLVALRSAGLPDVPALATLAVIFTSIVVEALPFILLGAIVSAAIAVWVPDSAFTRLARLPRALQVPAAAVAGVGFPVCECGSVPVARRLIARGIDPAAGVAFMLAAPILNPIVIAATWVAYEGSGQALEMTAARAGLGLLIAVLVGTVVGKIFSGDLLRKGGGPVEEPAHEHGDTRSERVGAFSRHLAGDFFFMGKFLVIGAAAAAVLQTVLPQSFISGIGGAHSQIGALAASKKLTARGIDPAALGERAAKGSQDVSFLQLSVAAKDPEFAREHEIQPGRAVRLLGFVAEAPRSRGAPFELSRFYVACCVADAIPFGATIDQSVVRGRDYDRDQWLEVSGEVVRSGRRLSIRATRVKAVKPPDEPYLSFAT
ncbi:MAG: permease [Thermoleophilaceae bacterium]